MVSKKKNLFLCEDVIEISALRYHRSSPLGKARDETNASTGQHLARLVMRRRLLLVTAGKGLTSWLLLVISECDFVTFPGGTLGQVWFLIVFIPDLCRLSYFYPTFTPTKESQNSISKTLSSDISDKCHNDHYRGFSEDMSAIKCCRFTIINADMIQFSLDIICHLCCPRGTICKRSPLRKFNNAMSSRYEPV